MCTSSSAALLPYASSTHPPSSINHHIPSTIYHPSSIIHHPPSTSKLAGSTRPQAASEFFEHLCTSKNVRKHPQTSVNRPFLRNCLSPRPPCSGSCFVVQLFPHARRGWTDRRRIIIYCPPSIMRRPSVIVRRPQSIVHPRHHHQYQRCRHHTSGAKCFAYRKCGKNALNRRPQPLAATATHISAKKPFEIERECALNAFVEFLCRKTCPLLQGLLCNAKATLWSHVNVRRIFL